MPNNGLDMKSFQAGPATGVDGSTRSALVVEQFGRILLVDPATGMNMPVPISIHGELANLAPHRVDVPADEIQNAALSPTGARAVFEAHGEIFTVPAEKGDTRNLTNTPGVAERNPVLEPGRQDHRLFLRRLRRVPALPARPDRLQAAHGHRPWPRTQLLLQPHLVAGLQAHRLRRQAPAALVCGCAGRQASADRQGHLRELRNRISAPSGRPTPSGSLTAAI